MRNLDIADTRQKIGIYHQVGLMGAGREGGLPLLPAAGPDLEATADAGVDATD
jgi:argininosuccinate synthase